MVPMTQRNIQPPASEKTWTKFSKFNLLKVLYIFTIPHLSMFLTSNMNMETDFPARLNAVINQTAL
jgi:hypothetical protein